MRQTICFFLNFPYLSAFTTSPYTLRARLESKLYSSILNRYPVKIIEAATIEIKIAISSFLSTFLRIIISGRETAVTDIRNARDVPIGRPFNQAFYDMNDCHNIRVERHSDQDCNWHCKQVIFTCIFL